ncbi:hypothetical protein [Sphingobacterium wenxiniae]|uniref:Uncharacterized protein n=1 Tax=Sphingobacterium wenxiniae TaxID=683125 RepID=A0A1I6NUF9_9SPHI|nr:hypothetical protein [Sphingobacterium wenxiniae]SFS31573.1 hypothetical protein SAMN05660206_101107 [Sphingobacterium wenxiniae]
MKNRLFVSLLMLFLINIASSQTPLRSGDFTVNGIDYKIGQLELYNNFVFSPNHKIEVPKNPEMVRNNTVPSVEISPRLTNREQLKNMVKSNFTAEQIHQLRKNKEYINLTMFVDSKGKPLYIWFGVDKNTILTIEQLAKVHQTVKTKFVAETASRDNLHLELNSSRLSDRIYF